MGFVKESKMLNDNLPFPDSRDKAGFPQDAVSRECPETAVHDGAIQPREPALDDVTPKARRIVGLRVQAVELWRECLNKRPPGTKATEATRRFVTFWNAAGFPIRVSQSRLYAWLGSLRRLGQRGLIDRHYVARSPKRPKVIPEAFWQVFLFIFLSEARCSVQHAWNRALLRCPSDRQAEWAEQYRPYLFASRLKGLDPVIEAARRRNGIRACELN